METLEIRGLIEDLVFLVCVYYSAEQILRKLYQQGNAPRNHTSRASKHPYQ